MGQCPARVSRVEWQCQGPLEEQGGLSCVSRWMFFGRVVLNVFLFRILSESCTFDPNSYFLPGVIKANNFFSLF